MSPSSRDPNANRTSRLKIKKESHPIQKPSSSATSSTSSSTTNTTTARNQPLIIYTSSPKVIHTEPRDFMALVQKLTGLSHTTNTYDDIINNNVQKEILPMLLPPPPPPPPDLSFEDKNNKYNSSNVNGDGQLMTCSSISSNSLSPNSEGVSPPPPTMLATMTTAMAATMGFDQAGLLESSCMLYPELTDMMSPAWAHPSFGFGEHQDLF